MSEHTKSAENVEHVAEPKAEPTAAMQTQLANLQGAVQHLMESESATNESEQMLRLAGEKLGTAVQAFRAQDATIKSLLNRVATLERKCQSLADRPMIYTCQDCGKKLDARASHCPQCGAIYADARP